MKGYSAFPKAPASDFLVPYPRWKVGGLTPLQRFSRCILQPQPTGQEEHGIKKKALQSKCKKKEKRKRKKENEKERWKESKKDGKN